MQRPPLTSVGMDDFPRRLADLLESLATRVRALTVDRVDRGLLVAVALLPALSLALIAVVFFFLTVHGALAIPLGDAGAFAVLGGLFALGGVFTWRNRISKDEP